MALDVVAFGLLVVLALLIPSGNRRRTSRRRARYLATRNMAISDELTSDLNPDDARRK